VSAGCQINVKKRKKNAAIKQNYDKIKLIKYDLALRSLAGIRVTFHLTRPSKKPEELSLLRPEEIPEIASPHRVCLLA
jgi:hypothetical protein